MALNLGELLVRLGIDVSGFEKNLTTAAKNLQKQGEKMERIGDTLTKAVSLPLIGMGVLAGKAAIDFESAFAGVRKTVNATEGQFKELERGIIDMSRRLPASTTEISAVAEAAGQLGIQRENILGFSETMLKLGTATNLASTEAATSLARLANITGMPQTEFDKLGSTIVALGNNLATTEAEIVSMGLRLAGAGKTVGLTQAQILGFAGALSSVGIEAEAGGTAFSRVMIEIKNQVASSGDNLEKFAAVAGMSTDKFKTAFERDAAGAIISFVEGLGRMQTQGQNVFPVLDALELGEIRVRDALLRASNAGDLFRSSIALGSKAWQENTALTKEAEQRYKTMASKLQIMRNELSIIAINIGTGLVPALQSAMRNLKPLLDALKEGSIRFSEMSPASQDAIIKLALLAAAAGPAIKALTKLVVGISAAIAWGSRLVFAFQAMAGGAATFGEALAYIAGGTLALWVAGAAAAIAVGYLLIKNWDKIAQVGLNTWGALKVAVFNFVAGFLEGYGKLYRFFDQKEADRIETHAAGLRQMAAAEQVFIAQRKAAAANERQLAAMRVMAEKDFNKMMEERGQSEQAAAEAAKKAAKEKADAEADTQAAMALSAEAAEKLAKANKHALDVIDYQVGRLDAKWETYNATVGEVGNNAMYLARQKEYLVQRIALLGDHLREVSRQYEASKAKTGEYSDATMDLGVVMDQTKREITQTQGKLSEITGPIADAKQKLSDAAGATQAMKDRVAEMTPELEKAKQKFEETSRKVKELEDSNRDARQTIGDALGVMRDRIKGVADEMSDLNDSSKEAQQGIADAFSAMKARAGEVKDEISDLRSKMRDVASVRLAGEGALGQELQDLERREALTRLAINRLKLGGVDEKDARIVDLEKQLGSIGLQKENVRLRIETEIDPLKDQLKKLTDETKEMSFEEAKKAIGDYQKDIERLTDKHKDMTGQIDALTAQYGPLVPSIAKTTISFDTAAASLATYKSTLDTNAVKLSELTTRHDTMKKQYDDIVRSLGDLVPKIGDANLSFDGAKTKIAEMTDRITKNNQQLDGPGGLLALQAEQKRQVGSLDLAMKILNDTVNTLAGQERLAASALDQLRAAASAAAAAVGSIPAKPSAPPNLGGSGGGGGGGKGLFTAFASGGIVKRPTLGLVGEAGTEIVMPLAKIGEFLQPFVAKVGAYLASYGRMTRGSPETQAAMVGGDASFKFLVQIGDQAFEDAVIRVIDRAGRRGRS